MPFINLPFLLSLAALGWGYWNHRRAGELDARLNNARSSHFRFVDQAREQMTQLETQVRTLQLQLRSVKEDSPLFSSEMTIAEATMLDARVPDLLGSLHIGGCSSCAVHPEETLAQAAAANGKDVHVILQALNKLNSPEAPQVLQMLERQPNVRLSL